MLEYVATFVTDWVPPIGIIAGGCWVFYRWLYDEKLRKLKERSSLDGSLTFERIDLSETKCLLLFSSSWTNRSPYPFAMDTAKTGIDIYKLSESVPLGAVDIRVSPEYFEKTIEMRPYTKLVSFVLEPNSCGDLQLTAVLEKGSVYLARFRLYRKTDTGLFSRGRTCICDLRTDT